MALWRHYCNQCKRQRKSLRSGIGGGAAFGVPYAFRAGGIDFWRSVARGGEAFFMPAQRAPSQTPPLWPFWREAAKRSSNFALYRSSEICHTYAFKGIIGAHPSSSSLYSAHPAIHRLFHHHLKLGKIAARPCIVRLIPARRWRPR